MGVVVWWPAKQMGCEIHSPSVFIMLVSSFIKMLMNIVFIYYAMTCAASLSSRQMCNLHNRVGWQEGFFCWKETSSQSSSEGNKHKELWAFRGIFSLLQGFWQALPSFFFFSHANFSTRFSLEGSPLKPGPKDDRCHCEWPHSSQDLPVQGVCSEPGGKGPVQHWDQQVMTVKICVLKGQQPREGKNAGCEWRNQIIICTMFGRQRSCHFPLKVLCSWQELGMMAFGGCRRSALHGRGVLILPEYQLSRILEMTFCSCAKPQQLARAGVQPSPCHGNVTCGIHPDVTEKDGFIIFSFKCIPLLLWTKACCELELQNSWTLNGFFRMWEFDMKNIERAERNNLEGVTDTGPELLLIQACNLSKEL